MLKKMLKGFLAIAAICAMASAASAETKVGTWVGASIGTVDGTITNKFYTKTTFDVTGEKVTAHTQISDFPAFGEGDTYVTWSVTDMVDVTVGKYSDVSTWGNSVGSWFIPATYNGNKSANRASVFSNDGVHSKIKLDPITIAAGMANVSNELKPYVWAYGAAGDIHYAAGYKADGGMAVNGWMGLGDMAICADVGMPTVGDMGMAFIFKYNNLGPGNLAFRYGAQGSNTGMELNYQYKIEPGKTVDFFYGSAGSGSEIAVNFFAMF